MLIPSWINSDEPIEDPLGCGQRAVDWLRRLKHPKNPAPGHPFQLDPWQERIIRKLYGPRNEDGSRKVRRLVLVVPRGNRKTSLGAAITLLHLIGPEKQPGNLIVSAASAHEQALELFNETATIVQGDGRLSKHLSVRDYTSSISFRSQRSRYIAVASDGKVQHGKTPNVVIADELHVWEGKAGQKQWEALDSALVKVPGTLLVVATTAGRGQENLAWKTVDYAIRVQKGEIDDPATLPVIFMAEEGDDWQSEEVWHALNPGMAHGYPDLESYRDKARKAIASPSDRDSFLQYNLNRWLDHSTSPFVEMSTYDKGKCEVDLAALEGKPCWLGVDLSSNSDLTAVVACWRDGEDGYQVNPWFFCPEDNLRRRADKDGVPYPTWAEQRLIIPTPGNVVDFRMVEDTIREICATYSVREIAFDPHLARNMLNNLLEDGYPAVEMRQGWVTMAPAIKELERAIVGGRFRHGGHPILRWHFDNIAVETDKAGNKSFHKGKSRDRIDGAQACAMAVARCAAGAGGTVYDSDIWSDELAFV
jgi:phage terminase large subunit-like protein